MSPNLPGGEWYFRNFELKMDEEEQQLLLEQARFNLQKGRTTATASVVRCSNAASESAGPATSQEDLLPILGNIVERPRGGARAMRETIKPGEIGTNGFPRAEHRSSGSSRFKLLGRRTGPVSPSPSRSQLVATAKSEGTSEGTSEETSERDADAIIKEMSAKEIEDAREELLARLPSKTVEFLRARNAKREQVAAAEDGNRDGNEDAGIEDNGRKLDALENRNDLIDFTRASKLAMAPEVERLRFDLSGRLVELGPEVRQLEECATLQRDLLRYRGEGAFYSVKEACTLVRSTDANQRIFGLRLLQAILKRCRDGLFRNPQECVSSSIGEIKSDVTWIQLWHHAVYVAQVAKTVRYALDDEKPKVVRAACGALMRLLEARIIDARYRHAPRCQVHHMQRVGASAGSENGRSTIFDPLGNQEWISMPLDIGERRHDAQDRRHADDDDGTDERDIARVDPVSGLLNMRILHRVCFLLRSLQKDEAMVPMAAKGDLLEVLRSLSIAGGDVSRAIARTPKLLETLVAYLPTYHDEPDALAEITLEIISNLVDYVSEWSDSAIRIAAKYASNAVLCHPDRRGVARLWRALHISGHIFTTLDDLYPKLCFSFGPEAFLLAACSCESGNASAAVSLSVLNEACDCLESFDRDSFYDAEDVVYDKISSILLFAQCCWQRFCMPETPHGNVAEGDTGDGENSVSGRWKHGNQTDATHSAPEECQEQRTRVSDIRASVIRCCQQAAVLIIPPDGPSRVAECTLWGTAMRTAFTVFMNLGYLVNDRSELAKYREVGQAVLSAYAADSATLTMLDDPDIIQPWDAPRLQRYVDIACLVDAIETCTGECDISLNLRLLAVLPPGSDRIGLRLLSHVFGQSATDIIRTGMNCASEGGQKAITFEGDLDDLRVQVLSGLSASIGYELQDAAGWTSLRSIQNTFVGRRSIMDGNGSVFPLRPGWEFAAARASADVSSTQGILAWILGILKSDVSLVSSAVEQHAALFGALFGSSYRQASAGSFAMAPLCTGDPSVQSLANGLFEKIIANILSQRKTPSEKVWTVPMVREAAEILASDSFGDAFLGACFSTLFCDGIASRECQEEIIAILKDSNALHYLPSIERAPLGGCWIVSSDHHLGETMDFQFLLSVIASQAFDRAMATGSLAVDVIMTHAIRGADSARKMDQITRRLESHGTGDHVKRVRQAFCSQTASTP